jgi:hypothetical protein
MHRWLLGPSLSRYLRVRPEDGPPLVRRDVDFFETKQLLKEHLLGTILERALDGMADQVARPAPPPPKVSTALVPAPRGVTLPVAVGYYVYAITLYTPDLWLAERGVDPTHPIYRYPFGKAQALISKVSLEEFGERALQLNLNDRAWFRDTVERHNRVLAAVQTQGPLVPMRVCTICDSLENLKAFLQEHYDDFVLTLGVVEGKKEWEIEVYCNERKLRLLTEKASSRVRALQAEIAGKPAEETGALHSELERVVAEETRAVCRACIRHSNGALSGEAEGTAILPVAAGRTWHGKRLIFHAAYLIHPAQGDGFEQQVKQLQKSYESLGFEFLPRGPLPATRFSEQFEPARAPTTREMPARVLLAS